MRYALSNRQLKELENGKLIPVAIPIDGDVAQTEEDGWFCDRLRVHPDLVRRVYRSHVWAIREDGHPGGLASLIGPIWREGRPEPPAILISIECLIGELCERDQPRSRYPVQWPGRLVIVT